MRDRCLAVDNDRNSSITFRFASSPTANRYENANDYTGEPSKSDCHAQPFLTYVILLKNKLSLLIAGRVVRCRPSSLR